MPPAPCLASPPMTVDRDTLLLIFVAITGLAVLLQAVVLFAMYLVLRKTTGMLQQQIDELRASVMPVVTSTQNLLTSVGPKIESVAKDVAEISARLRSQSEEVQVTTSQFLAHLQKQSGRVDTMLTSILDTLERAGNIVTDTINLPIRQISSILAFAKAAIGALRSGPASTQPRPTHAAADKDMFV